MLRLVLVLGLFCPACDGESDADRFGVGAECANTDECYEVDDLVCLPQFKGGYCGLQDCANDLDCPDGSGCVTHTDSINYCFRICLDKGECNRNRSGDNESNCSSNVTFTDGVMGRKACVPPSS